MSILNKFTENLNREFNTKSIKTPEFRMPAVTRDHNDSISMKMALLMAFILHPVVIIILWLVITILAIFGIHLTLIEKPKPHVNDIEFVLVDQEATPKNKNTKYRADKNSRTGGINDPTKPVSMPSSAASKPSTGGNTAPRQPQQKPVPPKKQSFMEKITQSITQETKTPVKTQQKQTTTQKKVTPAPEVQQAVPKPQVAKPNPPTARPSIKPPMSPKPTQRPTNTPFKVPVPSGGTRTGQYSTGPIGGSGSSSKGGSSGSGNYAPNPTFAPVGNGSGSKIASGSGAGRTGAGSGSGRSGYSSGSGSGGGNPGGGGGRPGIDAVREPDFGPYMRELQRRIKMNWEPPKGNESKRVVLLFKIAKDGRLLSVSVFKSSGLQNVDQAAINAVKVAAPFRALPPEYRGQNIDIQFTFDYNVYGGKVR